MAMGSKTLQCWCPDNQSWEPSKALPQYSRALEHGVKSDFIFSLILRILRPGRNSWCRTPFPFFGGQSESSMWNRGYSTIMFSCTSCATVLTHVSWFPRPCRYLAVRFLKRFERMFTVSWRARTCLWYPGNSGASS